MPNDISDQLTHTHYKCNINKLPSIINGSTTSWFISSKFSCPILTSYKRYILSLYFHLPMFNILFTPSKEIIHYSYLGFI